MTTENAIIEARAAGEGVRRVRAGIGLALQPGEPDGPWRGALEKADATLKDVEASLEAMARHLDLEVAPTMRDCPACGASIRADATRCGHCWTAQ